MVPELSWVGISQAAPRLGVAVTPHLVQLHKTLPQAINLLAVDCMLLASISQAQAQALSRASLLFGRLHTIRARGDVVEQA